MPMRLLCPPASTAALSGASCGSSRAFRSSARRESGLAIPIAHHYNREVTSRVAAVGPGSAPYGVSPMDQVTTYRMSSGQHLWRTRRGAVLVFGPLPP